jgi:GNAT superfamily N-acetyltransferase
MTVRGATAADLPAIERMAARFLGPDGPYAGRYGTISPGAVGQLLEQFLLPGAFAVVLEDVGGAVVGMFGAFLMTHPILGQLIAAELCWWVDPEARGARAAVVMLEQCETWARGAGARFLEIIAPNERVGVFYERRGFEKTDTHFLKVLA